MRKEPSDRQKKVAGEIRELLAGFINQISNKTSLITVTSADISPDLKQATVYVTVLPIDQEDTALAFLRRRSADMRTHVKKHLHIRTIPYITLEIDEGEKNRQRIDELLHES